ncbi:MAG: bifunctional riboflavin kinase/FAD synthetase [Bifidobacteriaceae bacterium]|nr:bifunctional riboflavin kinase/FAD synthetase [Bifidobacteriaceae bacterium]
MQRWKSLADVPADFGPSVVTLGNFDGMHRGHQFLVGEVARRARARGAKAVAVTFYPHPVSVHRPDRGLVQLQPLAERLEALEAIGLDAVLVAPYSLEFSRLSPRQFAESYLVEGLRTAEVVVGQDIHFGADNSGDLGTMRELGAELGFDVVAIGDQGDPEDRRQARWSSSAVRQALENGDAAEAARVLGRLHRVVGQVVRGDGRGRGLGFPTANLGGHVTGLIPQDGVYAGYLIRVGLPEGTPDRVLPAAISIGVNPTFAGRERRVEAYVLGRDDLELYGETVAVDFVARLRHTLTFSTQQALITQMHDDSAAASRVLAGQPATRRRTAL